MGKQGAKAKAAHELNAAKRRTSDQADSHERRRESEARAKMLEHHLVEQPSRKSLVDANSYCSCACFERR
jgi:hypothetical protein